MSNVVQLPVPLTLNERFLRAFMAAEAPCAALGLVEEAGQAKGFVAARIDERLPMAAAQSGFDVGYELIGTARYPLMHFILNFQSLPPYDILLNPNNPVVRKVVEVMRETAQYFFFLFEAGSMVAFHRHMDAPSLYWFNTYGGVVNTATTTPEAYERGLQRCIEEERFLHGRLLDWVCREERAALDLQTDRFEVRAG